MMRRATFTIAFFFALFACAGSADADEHLIAGVDFAWLHATSVSGGLQNDPTPGGAEAQSPTLSVQPYVDFPLLPFVALGLGVPATFNSAGPTSTASDIGIAPRVRLTLPIDDRFRPFVLVSPSLSYARLPTHVWWTGWTLRATAGLSMAVTGALRAVAQLGFERARFEGDSPTSVSTSGNGATLHGSVATNAFVTALGVELAF